MGLAWFPSREGRMGRGVNTFDFRDDPWINTQDRHKKGNDQEKKTSESEGSPDSTKTHTAN